MAISSTSTQEEIIGQYLDNVGYDHAGSVASCQLFIQAIRALLVSNPADWQKGQHRITFQPAQWRQELQQAQVWLNAQSSAGRSGSVRHLSFGGDFR